MTRLFLPLIIIAGLLVFSGCAKKYRLSRETAAPESAWVYPRKDIRASGQINSHFSGRLDLKWEVDVSEGPIGPMTIGAGTLVFTGSRRRIYFFDMKSGKSLGIYRARRNVPTGVVVVDSLAYLGVAPGCNEFLCLNLHSRKAVWSRNLKDVNGGPIIIDNRIYIGSDPGLLFCLDRLTGKVIWKQKVDGKCLAGPSGNNETVYFPLDNGTLTGFDAMNGAKVLEIKLGQPLVSKTVVGDRLYVAGIEGSLFAIDRGSGLVVWDRKFEYPIWTTPALDDGCLYLGDNGGIFRALKASDGSTLWEFESGGVIRGSAIVAGDYVLFPSLDRFLYCLDKQTGHLVSRREFKHGISFSAISDGKNIYVAADDGTIQCFGE
nr:PQQ-binding-like beta-propeller repeat protein [candidate division Zixibacteria bacterium]